MNRSAIVNLVMGDEPGLSLQHRIFNFFCATGFFVAVFSLFLNYYVGLQTTNLFVSALLVAVTGFCWYMSRILKKQRAATVTAAASLLLVLGPAFWITNGGTMGGAQYFLIVWVTLAAALSKPGWHLVWGLLLAAFLLSMIVFEYYNPELIQYYPSRLDRYIDVSVSMIGAILVSSGLYFVYSNSYLREHRRVQEYMIRLEELAITDHLTGLYNRAHALQCLEDQIYEAGRYEQQLSIIMIDFDCFKQINDSHGHKAGDQVLKAVAGIFRDEVRASDVVSRYGGEEFLIICPNSDLDQTITLAERLRRITEERSRTDYSLFNLTLSCGITCWSGEETESLIDHADQAMYEAKRSGRNCIRVYNPNMKQAI